MNCPSVSPSSRTPQRRALLIGVSEYAGPGIRDLPGADANPVLLAPELVRRGFTCKCLLNQQATRCAITTAITRLILDAEPGDVCLIAYSGHGDSVADPDTDEPDGANEFIYPHDAGPFAAAIRDDELATWLKQARAGVSVYCVFDACHSGTMPDGFLPLARRWWWRTRRFFRRVSFWFRRRVAAGGRAMVYSACRDDEVADYSQRNCGSFTDTLVKALRSDALTSNEALGQHLARSFEARGYRQHPEFRGPPQALRAGIFEPYCDAGLRSTGGSERAGTRAPLC